MHLKELCTAVAHNKTQSSSELLISFPPDLYHCSDAVY